MTLESRDQIVGIIKKAIRLNGFLLLGQLKDTLGKNGISEDVYKSYKLKAWLDEFFPEFRVVGTNGREQVLIADKVLDILLEMVNDEGRLLLSSVAPQLNANGIDWHQKAMGRKIYEWILESYPGAFTLSRDMFWLEVAGYSPGMPQVLDENKEAADMRTRSYVYKFCFCPADSAILRLLKELTGDESLSKSRWGGIRTIAIAQCLMGLNGGILDGNVKGTAALAFNTGLKTCDNQEIYGILEPNPNQGATQKWILSAVAFPGQDTEWGRSLCRVFGLKSQLMIGNRRLQTIERASASLSRIKEVHRTLCDEADLIKDALLSGAMLPDDISNAIVDYIGSWGELQREADKLMGNDEKRITTIREANSFINSLNGDSIIADEIRGKYIELVNSAWKVMNDYGLCETNRAEDNIASVEKMLQQGVSLESVNKLHEFLEPFNAIRELRFSNNRVFDDHAVKALESINEHFGSTLSTKTARVSIQSSAEDDDWSFLERIPEIRALLTQIESGMLISNTERSMTDEEILSSAINETIWQHASSAIKKPNSLETAIMLGDNETIREIVSSREELYKLGYSQDHVDSIVSNAKTAEFAQERTPLLAAERLKLVFGRPTKTIEQCLLLAIASREEGAVEQLGRYYLETDRPKLANILFDEFRNSVPAEVRSRLILEMLKNGHITLQDAVNESVLPILAPEGVALLEQLNEDPELKGRLIELSKDISPTVIHHIVYLNTELQSYIIQPENAAAIKKYSTDKEQADLIEVLRQNTFERGDKPLQVARRLYQFIGVYGDLALRFAELSFESDERQKFIFELYRGRADDRFMADFMAGNPTVMQDNCSYYVGVLFRLGRFYEIANAVDSEADLTTEAALQRFLSVLKSDMKVDRLPDIDYLESTRYPQLITEISKELLTKDPVLHGTFVSKAFPFAVSTWDEDELRLFATADDSISDERLLSIAKQMAEECPIFSIYCGTILNASAFDELRNEYLGEWRERFSELGAEEKASAARELRALFPDSFKSMAGDIFKSQISDAIDSEADISVKADRIGVLLKGVVLDSDGMKKTVDLIGRDDVFCHAPVYSELYSVMDGEEAVSYYLEEACKYLPIGDENYQKFICSKIILEHKSGKLPESFILADVESYILKAVADLDTEAAFECICDIERIKGRDSFLRFAEYIKERSERMTEAESVLFGEKENDEELGILCNALEDDGIEIEEYLEFCAFLVAAIENASKSIAADDDLNSASDIHALYMAPSNPVCWDAVEQIIPQERSRARAKALFKYASTLIEPGRPVQEKEKEVAISKANAAWARCLNYCINEDQDDLFYDSIRSGLKTVDAYYTQQMPWYSIKQLITTIQKNLDSSDDLLLAENAQISRFPVCDKETAELLINDLVAAFKRINADSTKDENHQTLRAILELGLRLECENIILESFSDELTGPYVNLGIALTCRLLLKGKIDTAMQFMHSVVSGASAKNHSYPALISKLMAFSLEELEDWLNTAGSKKTLRFILPDGNKPDILRLQTLTMDSYIGDEQNKIDCACAIENLIECYPEDVMCHKALFIVCKELRSDSDTDMLRVYNSLRGIYKFYAQKERKYYTRSREEVLTSITIMQKILEKRGLIDAERESITDLIREYCIGDTDKSVSEQNQLGGELERLFNSESDYYSLLESSLLGAVTGNWMKFFTTAFDEGPTQWKKSFHNEKFGMNGLLRSALREWQSIRVEKQRKDFVDWIKEAMKEEKASNTESKFYRIMNAFVKITENVDETSVHWNMLRLPWEEHLVCLGNLPDLDRAELNCCYKVMMAERSKVKTAKDSFVVMVKLTQDVYKAQLLYTNANAWFKNGDYELADAAYDALYVTKVYPAPNVTTERRFEYLEEYQTWQRISHAFSGLSVKCSNRSCMNMMCALVNAGYAKRFDRLRNCFADNSNSKLFRLVRWVLASCPTDDELEETVSKLKKDTEAIAFLRFVLSEDKSGEYLFLRTRSAISSLKKNLERLEGTQPDAQKQKERWIPLHLRVPESVFPVLGESEETSWQSDTVSQNIAGQQVELSFSSEIERFNTETIENIQEAIKEHGGYNIVNDRDCSKRIRLSAAIYSYAQKNQIPADIHLIRFGCDYYNYYWTLMNNADGGDLEFRERYVRCMFDLAIYAMQTSAVSPDLSKIPYWFERYVRSFSTIGNLLEDYAKETSGYWAIIKLQANTEFSAAANALLDVLKSLLEAINRFGPKAVGISAYQAAQMRLTEGRPPRDWEEMIKAVVEMIRKEINNLDQRPSLKVSILNGDMGFTSDAIYGEIENTGRESATQLEIQASFPQNELQKVSSKYRLSALRPNERATFSVAYSAPAATSELEYVLSIAYRDKEDHKSLDPIRGRLKISPNEQYSVDPFNTQTAASFSVDQTGEIVSSDFTGRKTEIAKLTSLLNGERFSEYRSAMVQGIKRSGKTSLLNYLETYIKNKKSDSVVPIKCDCQNIEVPNIYKVFFREILDKLPLQFDDSEVFSSNSEWHDFESRWRLPEGSDYSPDRIGLFFLQLHKLKLMEGKGIYLIVDEFDKLLDVLERGSGYDPLLRALRSLQMSQEYFEAVHMVLCGANYLLVYNETGSAFNQMFQSYEIIPVGQMNPVDIQEMIADWVSRNPPIRFAESEDGTFSPSIRWIERYTGGLVWYTRLLVNEAVKKAMEKGRNCIYPTDICEAFDSICNMNNCRQLAEGTNDNDEIVLDAMQHLASNPARYVSIEQLTQLLEGYLSATQVRKSLLKLTDTLKMLEQKAPTIYSYRFRIELYRRWFRKLEWLDNNTSRFGSNANNNSNGGDCFVLAELGPDVKTENSKSKFSVK